ncbi:unnamed protein product [Phyllotreta striolata]|uniref:Nuclear pore membrane glycoprotein 210 n=1 Tax=Phyllotreta striolata TaxID=444603 RepID=A0A9N9TYU2_PHYSR|nr:unnamed protein product [Phyllotreta striolata]
MARPLYFIVNLILLCATVRCSKLNVPRILLPIFNDFATNFILEATEGGCYKWATTRSDLIGITPLDQNPNEDCSTKVLLFTISKEKARNIAVVLAEDLHSRETLRCDVILDTISELRITTTTRELFMEEAPEHFEVNAYDDQGNEFSTLEGIEFEWNIVTLSSNKQTVLRYITYKDSPYEAPTGIVELEERKKKGHSVLLEGVKSGSAKVTVSLPFNEYKNIPPCEVQLMVVANILITPPEVYVMKGDVAQFNVFFLKNGRIEAIKLPDNQYYLETENKDVAMTYKESGMVEGVSDGSTRVVLRDKHVDSNDPLMKLPAANIYVMPPEYLVLNIMPHKNWAVLVADHHDIVAELYTKDDHKLVVGPNARIEMEVTSEFAVVSKSANGSWLTGYGLKPSVATVQAELKGVNSETYGKITFKSINAKNDIMIYPRMTIVPSEVILPWDPVNRPKFDLQLTVKGGDGRYLWISTDNSIGMVSQTGMVKTLSNGFFEVAAVMLRNHNNRASTKFIIIPPTRLEIVEFAMEAELGSPVYLHIALYAEQERNGEIINLPFTKCQELPFHIKMSDQKFRHNRTAALPPIGVSCGNIAMTALELGTSKVTVSYFQEGKMLEDSVTVSAFKKLKLIEPKREVVLAVGTTLNLVYSGGPRPMLGRSSEYSRTIVSENENIAQVKDVTVLYQTTKDDITVIQVLCAQLGETYIKLMISNTPSVSNCKPQTHSISTKIICGKPRKVTLQPELQIADTDGCPMDIGSGNVVVQSMDCINVEVSVYDECGNKFLNVTSLQFDWLVEPYKSARVLNKESVYPRNLTVGNVPVGHNHYQTIHPTVDKGVIVLNVSVSGYRSSIIKSFYMKSEWPPFVDDEDKGRTVTPLKSSISLYLVESPVIAEPMLTIFNHPGNKITVPITQGSGYFELLLSDDEIAVVKYLESSREIEITPMKSGELTVQVIDLCLIAKPANLVVNIIAVGIIRIEMVDKVEIGKCITAKVRLYDENDNLMNIPDPTMVDLRPEFENNIANIYLAEKSDDWGIGEVQFIITGVEIGETKLIFITTGNEQDVTSAPVLLQVFEPLKLSPKNGSIIINSKLQINSKGGPSPDVKIIFHAESSFVEVTDKGVVIGKELGQVRIYGRSVGVHPFTGQNIIYAEDYVDISIVKLQGLKLVGPILRFKIGTVAPFWVVGLPNLSPMILGGFDDPAIKFRWTVDDKLLIDLFGIFHQVGVFKKKFDRVSAKASALQIGKTRLFVNATVPGKTVNVHNLDFVPLSTWLDLEVIGEFSLVQPKHFPARSLLMAPFSELQLSTSMENAVDIIVTYMLPGDKSFSTDLLSDQSVREDLIVTVSSTGLIQSYGVLGQTLLIITSTDTMGLKQRLSIVVEVKAIQYMNLVVRSNWRIHADSQLPTVPLGTEFKLKALFYDNVGNEFQAGPKRLQARTSRCDLLHVAEGDEDASIWVHTKAEGSTMIKVWAEGIHTTTDYVKIHVEQSVKPELTFLTSGDVVCFWTPVVSEYNMPGTWKSSDDSLLHINPALDIAFVGNKEGTVILTHSFLPSAPIAIEINMVSHIEFLDTSIVLTNGDVNSVERIILVLQSDKSYGIKTNNLIQGWRCRSDIRKLVRPTGFKCFGTFSNTSAPVPFQRLYNITPSWVPDSGQFACKLINLGVNGTLISMLRTDVVIWATTLDMSVESEKQIIKFLPGVYVEKDIHLENTLEGEFTITGLPEVLVQIKVAPADSSILYVDEGTEFGETQRKYKLQVIDYHWRLENLHEAMAINVRSMLTHQRFNILVHVHGLTQRAQCIANQSPVLTFLETYKNVILSAVTMLIIFFLTFYLYSRYMQPVVNVNLHSPRGPPPPPGGVFNQSQSFYAGPSTCPGYRSALNASMSPRMTGANTSMCVCCQSSHCKRQEPIYGEAKTFYSTPDSSRRVM